MRRSTFLTTLTVMGTGHGFESVFCQSCYPVVDFFIFSSACTKLHSIMLLLCISPLPLTVYIDIP